MLCRDPHRLLAHDGLSHRKHIAEVRGARRRQLRDFVTRSRVGGDETKRSANPEEEKDDKPESRATGPVLPHTTLQFVVAVERAPILPLQPISQTIEHLGSRVPARTTNGAATTENVVRHVPGALEANEFVRLVLGPGVRLVPG